MNLDKVPKKYAGLDGTEIAISESQERMAVVVDPKDVEKFCHMQRRELEAAEVAVVTEDPRLSTCNGEEKRLLIFHERSLIRMEHIRKQQ